MQPTRAVRGRQEGATGRRQLIRDSSRRQSSACVHPDRARDDLKALVSSLYNREVLRELNFQAIRADVQRKISRALTLSLTAARKADSAKNEAESSGWQGSVRSRGRPSGSAALDASLACLASGCPQSRPVPQGSFQDRVHLVQVAVLAKANMLQSRCTKRPEVDSSVCSGRAG